MGWKGNPVLNKDDSVVLPDASSIKISVSEAEVAQGREQMGEPFSEIEMRPVEIFPLGREDVYLGNPGCSLLNVKVGDKHINETVVDLDLVEIGQFVGKTPGDRGHHFRGKVHPPEVFFFERGRDCL
jgi:hypothetical protein